jgi:F-type H+-transporting ATPase subunit a
MIFIWVVNMLGFTPLPLSDEKVDIAGVACPDSRSRRYLDAVGHAGPRPHDLVFTHIEGIRFNGASKYFKSWIPDVPKPILPLIIPLEILGQFMRLISLSVRLFANMLAGHILILTFIGLIFVLESYFVIIPGVAVATVFYVFEVVIVVSIQAFIFAALSAIYIGSAIEPEH